MLTHFERLKLRVILIRDYNIEKVNARKEWVFKIQLRLFRPNGLARFKNVRAINRKKEERKRKGNHRPRKRSRSLPQPVIGFSTTAVGIACKRNPMGIEIAPSTIEYAHWSPVNCVIENARPPTNIIRI